MPVKKKVDWTPFVKALLEFGRVIVLAVLPVLVSSINPETGAIAINWAVVFAVGLLAGLRFADKLAHEYGKATKDKILTLGLTRF